MFGILLEVLKCMEKCCHKYYDQINKNSSQNATLIYIFWLLFFDYMMLKPFCFNAKNVTVYWFFPHRPLLHASWLSGDPILNAFLSKDGCFLSQIPHAKNFKGTRCLPHLSMVHLNDPGPLWVNLKWMLDVRYLPSHL